MGSPFYQDPLEGCVLHGWGSLVSVGIESWQAACEAVFALLVCQTRWAFCEKRLLKLVVEPRLCGR